MLNDNTIDNIANVESLSINEQYTIIFETLTWLVNNDEDVYQRDSENVFDELNEKLALFRIMNDISIFNRGEIVYCIARAKELIATAIAELRMELDSLNKVHSLTITDRNEFVNIITNIAKYEITIASISYIVDNSKLG